VETSGGVSGIRKVRKTSGGVSGICKVRKLVEVLRKKERGEPNWWEN
jgi:hypothetical protein